MASVTLVLNVLKHNILISLGGEISPEEEDESKEVLVIESSGDHELRRVGFVANDPDDDEEDAWAK